MSCGCYQHRSGSLPELIEAKRRGMQDVVARLSHSEVLRSWHLPRRKMKPRKIGVAILDSFRLIARRWSFFWWWEKLSANSSPAFVQSHLGFHAVQVVEVRPTRVMIFGEALPEIKR